LSASNRRFVGARLNPAAGELVERIMFRFFVGVCIAVAIAAHVPAFARPANEVTTAADLLLTMEEAARLAAVDQPLLTGREAKIEAEEQQAVAAAAATSRYCDAVSCA